MSDSNDAKRIIEKYIIEFNSKLSILNEKLSNNDILLLSKKSDLDKLIVSFDGNADIFIPEALRDSTREQIDSLKYEISLLEDNSNSIKNEIDDVNSRIDELNIVSENLSIINENNNTDILDNIDLCIKLMDVDTNRVKQELFHVKHLLEES